MTVEEHAESTITHVERTAEHTPSLTDDDSQGDSRNGLNFWFRLIPVFGAMFVITILALVTSILSDPRAPIVKFLDRWGSRILIVEVILLIVISVLAMAVDRWRFLRQAGARQNGSRGSEVGESPAEETSTA